MKKFLSIIKAWFLKKGGKHNIHSKRPSYLKAELLDAAQEKRLRKNAKRLAEVG